MPGTHKNLLPMDILYGIAGFIFAALAVFSFYLGRNLYKLYSKHYPQNVTTKKANKKAA